MALGVSYEYVLAASSPFFREGEGCSLSMDALQAVAQQFASSVRPRLMDGWRFEYKSNAILEICYERGGSRCFHYVFFCLEQGEVIDPQKIPVEDGGYQILSALVL